MALKSRQFLGIVVETALALIEPERPETRLRVSMAQLYFADRHQHYEVWLRTQAGLLELGLHFEGPREENLRRIAILAEAMPEVIGALGPSVEVEEWTESWTRLHEVRPLPSFDEGSARELGERLAAFVLALEPIVGLLGPMPAIVRAESGRGGRWRGRRRGAGRDVA